MSTFNSPHNSRCVNIRKHEDNTGVIIQTQNTHGVIAVYLDPNDAPAIALAVLEAAGHEEVLNPNGALEHAVERLAVHIRVIETKAAAAAEEAELEAEAEELYELFGIFPGWSEASKVYRNKWIGIARRARELATERNTK